MDVIEVGDVVREDVPVVVRGVDRGAVDTLEAGDVDVVVRTGSQHHRGLLSNPK